MNTLAGHEEAWKDLREFVWQHLPAEYEGRFNAFLNKCAIVPTPTTIGDPDLALRQLIDERQKFNLVSLNPCRATPLEKWHPTESDSALGLRYINNKIVCNSQSTDIPGLYIFDWEKVLPQNVN